VANANQSDSIDVDTLYVKKIMIDGGPMLKRFSPRAMGRATRILKRTSHITVVVDEA
jgi:large subunit ribosomal protein L22